MARRPELMLINDADNPARWYYRLKKERLQCRQDYRLVNNLLGEAECEFLNFNSDNRRRVASSFCETHQQSLRVLIEPACHLR